MRLLKSSCIDYQQDDVGLIQKHADVVHSTAIILENAKYECSMGRFQSTELGRIASHYYETHSSMESVEEPVAKINPISNVSIISFSGFMLVADMVFMQQSAGW
ncbi:hypothetical protein L208DRAFT_1282108 [Tricholoma matsutake]|nr:hypothetical protein L208DRAFT_1282108 [Tricholoma matsutake 945]